jgi:hypothetical protein
MKNMKTFHIDATNRNYKIVSILEWIGEHVGKIKTEITSDNN